MDIQAQVAARRAELARQAQESVRLDREAAAGRDRQERERRKAALDALATELSAAGTPVQAAGEELRIAEAPPFAALDPVEFKRTSLQAMLGKEARRRWTPGQNWLVIGSVTAGLLLLVPVFELGLLLLAIGFACRHSFNQRYRKQLVRDFPDLLGEFAKAPLADNSSALPPTS
ncbi:MAG: hypothetical protein ACJ8FS_17005 [Sphingomicrobium sp.]